MRRDDPSAAFAWRLALREAMTVLLRAGWIVTGFQRGGGYLVSPPTNRGRT